MNIQLIANETVTWAYRNSKHTGCIVAIVNKGDDILKAAKKLGITLTDGVSRTTKFNRAIIECEEKGQLVYYTPSTALLKKMVANVEIVDELAFLDDFESNFTAVKKQLAIKVRKLKDCEKDIADLKADLQDAYDEYLTVKNEIDNLKRSLGVALGNDTQEAVVKPLVSRPGVGNDVPEWLQVFINKQFSPSDVINRNASLRGRYSAVFQKISDLVNKGVLERVGRGTYAFAS